MTRKRPTTLPFVGAVLALALGIAGLACSKRQGPASPSAPPSASFTVQPSTGTVETDFFFDASSSSDLFDAIGDLRVRWDWENDGSWDTDYSNQKTATRRYPSGGAKVARMEVMDSEGVAASTTRKLYVFGALGCGATADTTSGVAPLAIAFDAAITEGRAPFTFAWAFGDGGSSALRAPSHTFAQTGTYQVVLTVTEAGPPPRTCRDTLQVRVLGRQGPTCVAEADVTAGVAPLSVGFTATAAGGLTPYAFHWEFGDGEQSDEPNPSHEYAHDGSYVAVLSVSDAGEPPITCRDSLAIVVSNALACDATATPESGALPLDVAFVASASAGTPPYAFAWDFGDGGAASEAAPSHTYTTEGEYEVIVTVSDSGDPPQTCRDTLRVSASRELSCAVAVAPRAGIAPLAVGFDGSATGGDAPYFYKWSFGDGDESDEPSPSHTYGAAASYVAKLTITDSGAPPSSCSEIVTITVVDPLLCGGTAVPIGGPAPLDVSFEGSGSGGTAPYAFAWDFGDGATSSVQAPAHSYVDEGIYDAVLTVSDSGEPPLVCADTLRITVSDALACQASANPNAGIAPLGVQFQASAASGTPPYVYRWEFGDGDGSDEQSPSHTFTDSGDFAVVLTVSDSGSPTQVCRDTIAVSVAPIPPLSCAASADPTDGFAPLPVAFGASAAGGVAPLTYGWQFGDGTSSSEQNPMHTFANGGDFEVVLSITDSAVPAQVCRDTLGVSVTEIPLLTCGADAEPQRGTSPLSVTFMSTVSGGTGALTLEWDFGDGGSDSGESPVHLYAGGGIYAAILTVTDMAADAQVCSDTVTITVISPLLCAASGVPFAGPAPLPVVFTGSGSGGVPPYQYGWAFGDGGTSPAQSPSHTYALEGDYQAVLTVTDSDSPARVCRDTVDVTVTDAAACLATADPAVAPASYPVSFTGSVVGGTPPYRYSWTFGDGQASSAQNPDHTYGVAGEYQAILAVTDSDSPARVCRDSVTVTVVPAMECDATASTGAGIAPATIGFQASVSDGTPPYFYSWSFDDNTPGSSSQNPNHTFVSAGSYQVSLSVTDSGSPAQSCGQTVLVSVVAPLTCFASGVPSAGVAPLPVDFLSGVVGGVAPYQFVWSFGDGGLSGVQNPAHTYTGAGSYSAIVTITDAGPPVQTCRDTVAVSVIAPLLCAASVDTASGVAPLDVLFAAAASGGVGPLGFDWDFGDGGSDIVQNPPHRYVDSGAFEVVLTVTDPGPPAQICRDTLAVSVVAALACSASADPSAGLAPLPVQFGSVVAGGVEPYALSWSFGVNDTTSDEPEPLYTYDTGGTYEAILNVTDSGSPPQVCLDTLQITVVEGLACSASVDTASGIAPLPVTFGSFAAGGTTPYTFAWDFGDGVNSDLPAPQHTYADSGVYEAVLTLTDAGQPPQVCIDTLQISVVAALTCTTGADTTSGIAPLTVMFDGAAGGGVSPYAFEWQFGDGDSSDQAAVAHEYADAGVYKAILRVSDSGAPPQACLDTLQISVVAALACTASVDTSAGVAPLTVNFTAAAGGGVQPYAFDWRFGDGDSSAALNPPHTYSAGGTYEAILTVADAGSPPQVCLDTLTITVVEALACSAGADTSAGIAPLDIAFTGFAVGGVAPYAFDWQFGDGDSDTTQSPNHTYADSGSYQAILTVTDSDQPPSVCADTLEITVVTALACSASADVTIGDAPLDVAFGSVVEGGVAPYTYGWVFGDGGVSPLAAPQHTYADSGAYQAILTVTDSGSPPQVCPDTIDITVFLPLSCAAAVDTVAGIAPFQVQFSGSAAGGETPYSFDWQFGDGDSSSQQSPAHTYADSGSFTAILTVTDSGNPPRVCVDSVQISAVLALGCVPSVDVAEGIAPLDVAFGATASGGVGPYAFDWAFGDGDVSGAQNPPHTYDTSGAYQAILTVTDSGSPPQVCIDSLLVSVVDTLTCQADADTTGGVEPLTVNFSGSAGGGLAPLVFNWQFGDGDSSAAQSPTHIYLNAGNYEAILTVIDSGASPQSCADTLSITVDND